MSAIIPATPAHAAALAPLLRPEDAAELDALGVDAGEIIAASIANSLEAWTWMADDEPGAIFGVSSQQTMGAEGFAWVLTGRAVENHLLTFCRGYRFHVKRFADMFPRLVNYVDARHEKALRWLAALGFVIEPPAPFGPKAAPFCRVVMETT